MTIIDREQPSISEDDLHASTEPSEPSESAFALSDPGRVLLAALLVGAGAIHLVMVPSHADEWMLEGIAFAVVGWLQIGLAIALFVRPSRAVLRVACLANVVLILAWVVSRIWGLPVGPDSGVPHDASFVDVTCVALEALVVVVGYELLAHPERGDKLSTGARTMLSVIPIAVLVLATAAIVSPSAAGHGHAELAGGEVADGHAHGGEATSGSATQVDDKGLSAVMNGQGEGGGHSHSLTTEPLDSATQQQLDVQLADTLTLAERYPTVADAVAAGYYRQGPFAPGLGAHYMSPETRVNVDGVLEGDDFLFPTLIYDGTTPDAKIAGFMYNIYSTDTVNAPEGFAGPNDHWHYHTNVCLTTRPDGGFDAPLGADTTATKELCDRYGGMLLDNTGYMVHVWTVPGYESSQGLFSNVNPGITCPDGTYYVVAPEEIGTRSNICKDVPA